MPRTINFDGKQIVEPGVYSQIKGLNPAPPAAATFGNVMLIDTGSGAGYGAGAGISGELESGVIYEFTDPVTFKRAVRGGVLYDLIDYLFSPDRNAGGPKKVYYGRAATTVAGKFAYNFGGGNGAVTIALKNEGLAGNGAVNGNGFLITGYGTKLRAGVINSSALIMDFFEGQYRGLDGEGVPYDGIATTDIKTNQVVASSDEFTTTNQLIDWMNRDANFKAKFKLFTSTASAVTLVGATQLASFPNLNLFTGGTTTYSTGALDTLLEIIIDLDNSSFLCDDYGIVSAPSGQQVIDGTNKGALSTFNSKINAHIVSDATYRQKAMFVGGGKDVTEYTNGTTGSEDVAKIYNSPFVILAHSDVRVPATISGSGEPTRRLSTFYHAAMACGRVGGQLPQDPITYKSIRVVGVVHEMKKSERERALKAGVLHLRKVANLGYVFNQGINTMQLNTSLIYQNGTSPEISIMSIIHQINKEMVMNATTRFIGGNIASASDVEIKAYIESQLQSFIDSGYIIKYEKVTVSLTSDVWNVTYCFVPNGPINRLFTTGFALDPNVQIN